MLDAFEIISTSGVTLWTKSYVPIGASLISSLIRDVFVEENASARAESATLLKPTYRKDGYTLKWTTAKDLGLIFVVFGHLTIETAMRQTLTLHRPCTSHSSISHG